nr:hypothetical protein [uncultured bacterium]
MAGGRLNETAPCQSSEQLIGRGAIMKACREGTLWIRLTSIIAVLLGLLTIQEGGAVIFLSETARRAAGQYVPFVVWFNFLAGFAYVIAGIGLWRRQRWATALAATIAASTLIVFIAFGLHVAGGGAYELRTVVAMSLRSAVWIAIAFVAYRFIWERGRRTAL